MKRTLSLFLSMLMVISIITYVPVTVSAASGGNLNSDILWEISDGGVLTISGVGAMPNYSFWTDSPFRKSEDIKEVIISDGITNVGNYAFVGCDKLTSVKLSDSVKTIGNNAFEYCYNLAAITIPDGVTYIGENAFYYCGIISIDIPGTVESIGNSAFNGCDSLDSISLGNGVINIGEYAFSGCGFKNLTIPESVTSIGQGAFKSCINLTTVTLPSGIKNIADYTFCNTKLESIKLPNSVTSIGMWAFGDCTSLISINIPESVTSIGDDAFHYCDSLTTITIPDSVTSIGNDAFHNCASLTSVEIGNGVTSIGELSFDGCTSLMSVEIGNGVTSIGMWAFGDCTSLISITIPESVTSIGVWAFGYDYSQKPINGFTICGTKGTAAETYAKNNCFSFVDVNHKHTSSSWITDKKATVYKSGSKHKECTECGEVLETATIKQLKCSKPKLSKIENTSNGVKITWGKVSGADSYEVYRKTGSSGKYLKIGTTSKTAYTDEKAKSGKKYYYYVKTVNEAGSSSASSSKSMFHLADTTLKTPSSTKNGIVLKWSKVTGAEGYQVWRKTGSGDYKKINTVKGNSKVTYTDKSAKKGKKYTYKVKAYKSKTYSAYSNTKTITDKY